MEAFEKVEVVSYFAECEVDSYIDGCTGETVWGWDDNDIPVKGIFDSVEDALKAIVRNNYFDYRGNRMSDWQASTHSGMMVFHYSTLVDVNNAQASDYQIEEWKHGRQKLYLCSITAKLRIIRQREVTKDELPEGMELNEY